MILQIRCSYTCLVFVYCKHPLSDVRVLHQALPPIGWVRPIFPNGRTMPMPDVREKFEALPSGRTFVAAPDALSGRWSPRCRCRTNYRPADLTALQ